MKKVKKEVVNVDEDMVCGNIAYGYSNKKEAKKAIEKETGDDVDMENLEKMRVIKSKVDGEDFFFFGDTCKHCGRKNDGIISYVNLS